MNSELEVGNGAEERLEPGALIEGDEAELSVPGDKINDDERSLSAGRIDQRMSHGVDAIGTIGFKSQCGIFVWLINYVSTI